MLRRFKMSWIALMAFLALAMSWPALLNGQPFIFPDTTTYVRSADFPIYLASGGRLSTAWTRTADAAAFDRGGTGQVKPNDDAGTPKNGNDIPNGFVMGGRSPYFGLGLYLSYVISNFWLFIAFASLASVILVRVTLKAIGMTETRTLVATTLFLAIFTTLPFYTSYLLADIFAGLGILALAVLATPNDRLEKRDRLFLAVLVLASAISHPTHVLILFAMTSMIAIMAAWKLLPGGSARFSLVTGAVAIAVSLAGTIFTGYVVETVFGNPSRMAPLLTARLIEDGPGKRFVDEHCHEEKFVVCKFADRITPDAVAFLWSTEPHGGVFLLATDAERRALSDEDRKFALTVIKHYPVDQIKASLSNAISQALLFDSKWLNYDCNASPECWSSVPEPVRLNMAKSISGKGEWPILMISNFQNFIVFISAIIIAIHIFIKFNEKKSEIYENKSDIQTILIWIALVLFALAVNAFLGGALSEPQNRYQGRIVWLIPFLAWLLVLSRQRDALRLSRSS